ncbi:MAG TPA: hypothetical protein VM598_07950 [Bdellovibrionota bacterium]|nr:hypothetical protein [Bdellovibrionota bacterium]
MEPRSLALAALLLAPLGARASGIDDLNRGLPLEIDDARPAKAGSFQPQAMFRYERTREGKDAYEVEPQLQYGFSPRGHVQFSADAKLGGADKSGSGDTSLGALYRLHGTDETTQVGLFAELEFPSGIESAGVDEELGLIVTQPCGSENGIHLNATLLHNTAPREGERQNGYRAAIGAHHEISDGLLVLADLVRFEEKNEDDRANLVEAGAVTTVGKDFSAAFGFGVGVGEPSPHTRATVSFQYSLGGG